MAVVHNINIFVISKKYPFFTFRVFTNKSHSLSLSRTSSLSTISKCPCTRGLVSSRAPEDLLTLCWTSLFFVQSLKTGLKWETTIKTYKKRTTDKERREVYRTVSMSFYYQDCHYQYTSTPPSTFSSTNWFLGKLILYSLYVTKKRHTLPLHKTQDLKYCYHRKKKKIRGLVYLKTT